MMPARAAGRRTATSSRVLRVRSRLLITAALVAAAGWTLSHAGTALVVEQNLQSPDAIIMLASHEWERLPAAAQVARHHPRAILLITVPRIVTTYTCHRCAERADWLVEQGVPRSRIRILPGTRNTYEEALAALDHAGREPFSRLVVVTSSYHTRRSLATFTKVFDGTGVKIGVLPAVPSQARPARWWLTPYDRYYVAYEWAAGVKNWWGYGIPIF